MADKHGLIEEPLTGAIQGLESFQEIKQLR